MSPPRFPLAAYPILGAAVRIFAKCQIVTPLPSRREADALFLRRWPSSATRALSIALRRVVALGKGAAASESRKTGGVSDRYVPAAGRAALTPAFDAVNAVAMRQGQWRPLVVARTRAQRPSRILDLGCGTGAMAIALGHGLPGARLIGIDGDPQVLRRANARARAAGVSLELHEALADRIPLPDSCVDCVVSTLVFHHLSPTVKRDALAEIRRVLMPRGRLLICDVGRAQDPIMRAAFFLVQLLDGFTTTRENAGGKLPQIVAEAGFKDVTVVGRFRTGGGTLDLIEATR